MTCKRNPRLWRNKPDAREDDIPDCECHLHGAQSWDEYRFNDYNEDGTPRYIGPLLTVERGGGTTAKVVNPAWRNAKFTISMLVNTTDGRRVRCRHFFAAPPEVMRAVLEAFRENRNNQH